jgi:hypothetical protein
VSFKPGLSTISIPLLFILRTMPSKSFAKRILLPPPNKRKLLPLKMGFLITL